MCNRTRSPDGCSAVALLSPIVQAARQLVVDSAAGMVSTLTRLAAAIIASRTKTDDRSPKIRGGASDGGGKGVAGVIERLVAADASGEGGVPDDSEGDGGDGRPEDRAAACAVPARARPG